MSENYEKMTVTELREEAKKYGLKSVTGLKKSIICKKIFWI